MKKIIVCMVFCVELFAKNMVEIDNMKINLLGYQGSVFLNISISFEFSNQNNKNIPLYKDSTIMVVSSKIFEEISTLKGKRLLKDEIKKRIEKRSGEKNIKAVYFTKFLIESYPSAEEIIEKINLIKQRCLED